MKKIKWILVIVLMFLLVGCGSSNQGENNPKKEDEKPAKSTSTEDLTLSIPVTFGLPYTMEGYQNYEVDNEGIIELDITNNKIIGKKAGSVVLVIHGETDTKIITKTYKLTIYDEVITCTDELIILVGEEIKLDYTTLSEQDATLTIKDSEIASINNGSVKGLKAGVTTLTINSFGASKTVEVEVLDNSNELAINDSNAEMRLGACAIYNGSTESLSNKKANEINPNLEFISSNEELLTVTKHGMLLPLGVGSVTLTIKENGKEDVVINIIIKEEFTKMELTDETKINIYGRVKKDNIKKELTFYHSGSAFECIFKGTEFKATIYSESTITPCAYVKVFIDGTSYSVPLDGAATDKVYTLASGLADGVHYIKVVKITEECYGPMILKNVEANSFITPDAKPTLKIEVYGDSITSGYGILGKSTDTKNTGDNEDCTLTYAYLAAQNLNAQINMFAYQGISLSIPGWYDFLLKDIYAYYGNTYKKGWNFSDYVPDVIVIYLGTNDSYGLSQSKGTATKFLQDYRTFINGLLQKSPDAQIICCYGMLSMNSSLVDKIKDLPSYYKDGNVHALKLDATQSGEYGANGHPNTAANARAAITLTNYIQEVLNKNKTE